MRATIKNVSKASQGIHTSEGLIFIEPGRQRTVTVAPGYEDRVRGSSLLSVTEREEGEGEGDGGATQQRAWFALADDEHGSGFRILDTPADFVGVAIAAERPDDLSAYRFQSTSVSAFAEPPPRTDHDHDGKMGGDVGVTSPAAFDDMDDDALRTFITERDGAAPHPNTGRAKLLSKARGET